MLHTNFAMRVHYSDAVFPSKLRVQLGWQWEWDTILTFPVGIWGMKNSIRNVHTVSVEPLSTRLTLSHVALFRQATHTVQLNMLYIFYSVTLPPMQYRKAWELAVLQAFGQVVSDGCVTIYSLTRIHPTANVISISNGQHTTVCCILLLFHVHHFDR